SYFGFSKWLALLAGVGTGVLYVGLLLVLALFADLMVNRGEIPCLHNLPARERAAWRESAALPDEAEAKQTRSDHIQQALRDLALDDPRLVQLLVNEPEKLSSPEIELRRHLLWFVDLPHLLQESVGAGAAETVRQQIR